MAEKKISQLTAKGATVADTDLLVVSESAGGGTYVTKSVTGANVKALVTDANLTTTDITTNDVSTSKHGFAPKAPNDTTKFLRGDGTWAVPASGGLTKFTEAENTSAPNGTIYVDSLTAAASSTNADFAIVPKGTGAILADIPDNTSAGGNKRGQYAVDWQMARTSNDRVASGNFSTVLGGQNSRSSGDYSISGGSTGIASGAYSTALQGATTSNVYAFGHGSRTTASGYGAVAFGAYVYADTTASGDNSFAGYSGTASATGAFAYGEGVTANGALSTAHGFGVITKGIYGSFGIGTRHNNIGDCQKLFVFLTARTTGNTATTMWVRGGDAGTNSATQLSLSNNTAVRFKGTIIGKQSGSANTSAWDIDGLIVRTTSAANTTLVVSNVSVVSNAPAWGTPTLAADTTNGGLTVQITGASATNIQWACALETTETLYA